MVEITSFADAWDAELAAAVLQAERINAFAGSHYHGEGTHSVHDRRGADTPVFVSQSDYDEAAALLARVAAGEFSNIDPDTNHRWASAARLSARMTPSKEAREITQLQRIAPLIVVPILILLLFAVSQLLSASGA